MNVTTMKIKDDAKTRLITLHHFPSKVVLQGKLFELSPITKILGVMSVSVFVLCSQTCMYVEISRLFEGGTKGPGVDGEVYERLYYTNSIKEIFCINTHIRIFP